MHLGIHGPRNKPENGRLAQKVWATTLTIEDIRQADHVRDIAQNLMKLLRKTQMLFI